METSPTAGVIRVPAGVALVTGASRGIGAATALELARRGWSVALASEPIEERRTAAAAIAARIREEGGAAESLTADLGDPERVVALVASAIERFGRLDVVVANAAVDRITPWREIPLDEWQLTQDVNVRSAWLLAREAYDALVAAPNPSIVFVTSTMVRTGQPGRLHYSASKAALVGITRALARELGPAGVRVNAVMPGAIKTDSETERFGDDIDEVVLAGQALLRRGTAEDVAAVIAFLVGTDSSFISGQVLSVDGGATFGG